MTRRHLNPRHTGLSLAVAMILTACVAGDSDGEPRGTDTGTEANGTNANDTEANGTEAAGAGLDTAESLVIAAEGLNPDWQDYGWATTVPERGETSNVVIDISEWGGWIVANPSLTGSFSHLILEVETSDDLGNTFLNVSLGDDFGTSFPAITPELEEDGDLFSTIIPMHELLAGTTQFDRLVFAASDQFDAPANVTIRNLALIPGDPLGSRTITEANAAASVDCAAPTIPISEHIYGTARPLDNDNDWQWTLELPSRRWGGNPTSRYNWELGTWNTAADYYWQNVDIGAGGRAHDEFLADNWQNGVGSAITIPMLDWVAKDDESYSFPVSEFGPQADVDPFREDAGNGDTPDGDPITPPDPTQTSVEWTPEDAQAWIRQMIDAAEAADQPKPFMYILDNEPMLWNSTHRDVAPEPVSYDRLMADSIAFAAAIRETDPDALIAGPAVWGWPAYLYSAVDSDEGFSRAPDRRAHDDTPLIEWYLQQMREYEEQNGVRLLDVLDVHFYPQDGSYGNDISAEAAERRIRTTRSLWDNGYEEESWIGERIELIPRMQKWVDDNYPGTKLSIGEYSFGAENHISGGLAQAEALGRFGQNGLFSAYYWVSPQADSPAFWAFRAFRNYDGSGSKFGELSVPTEADRPLSVFASATSTGDHNVIVAINTSPDERLATTIQVSECERTESTAVSYTGDPSGFAAIESEFDGDQLVLDLPPSSISVIELR